MSGFFEMSYYVSLAGLELPEVCLPLPEIKGPCHHTQRVSVEKGTFPSLCTRQWPASFVLIPATRSSLGEYCQGKTERQA